MKVLLLKAVPKLGLPGDVCEIKDGFGRNYLIPQGMAVLARGKQATSIQNELAKQRQIAVAAQENIAEQAKSWEERTVTVVSKATSDGTLFGAVTDRDLAEKLELDRRRIKFQPAKKIGDYEALIDLGQGVDVRIKVEVKPEKVAAIAS